MRTNFLRSLVFVSILICITSAVGFGQKTVKPKPTPAPPPPTIEEFIGTEVDGVYTNKYFKFRLTEPEDYEFVESQSAEMMSRAGIDMVKGENRSTNKRLDEAAAKQSTLFGWMMLPRGSLNNAVLEGHVLKQVPGVTANMALLASTNLMTATPSFKLEKTLGNVTFGKRAFAGSTIAANFNGMKFKIDTYVLMVRGYSLHFAVTYYDDEGKKKMTDLLRTIEFLK